IGFVVVEPARPAGRQADGDGDRTCLAGGRNRELCALAGRERQRHHGLRVGDALPGIALVDHGRAELARAVEAQARHLDALPPAGTLQPDLAGPVDAYLGDVRRVEIGVYAEHLVLVVQEGFCRTGRANRTHSCATTAVKSTSRAT